MLLFFCGQGNVNPLQYSCLENSMDSGAWWAAVHGIPQSWTRLKRLSMHARIGEGNGNPLQYSCLGNPGMEEPGGLSMGSHRVRHEHQQKQQHLALSMIQWILEIWSLVPLPFLKPVEHLPQDIPKHSSVSVLWDLWVLVCTWYVWVLWASLAGMGFDSKCDFTLPTILLGLLLSPWMWDISSKSLQCCGAAVPVPTVLLQLLCLWTWGISSQFIMGRNIGIRLTWENWL